MTVKKEMIRIIPTKWWSEIMIALTKDLVVRVAIKMGRNISRLTIEVREGVLYPSVDDRIQSTIKQGVARSYGGDSPIPVDQGAQSD